MKEKWSAFPDPRQSQEERNEFAGLLDLPDQATHRCQHSLFRHSGDLWIPLSINGRTATFFLDTGAGISAISESQAKRLGLVVRGAGASIGTSTGNTVGFRTAVASDLVAGNVHLKNVSFAVFPDNQEPWVHLPHSRRGLLGVPVLLAFRTLRWARKGTIEIGAKSIKTQRPSANLYFADDHLATVAVFNDLELAATLDTGAEGTDLYAGFANAFPRLLGEEGKKGVTEVRGVGRAETFDSVTLPKVTVRLGGLDTVLRPAHVLLKQIGPKCCVGNLGLDLLKQADWFKIDFDAMTLELRAQP